MHKFSHALIKLNPLLVHVNDFFLCIFQPPKGKAPTRGAKQIHTENTASIYFYRNISLCAALVYHTVNIGFYFDKISTVTIVSLRIYFLYIPLKFI